MGLTLGFRFPSDIAARKFVSFLSKECIDAATLKHGRMVFLILGRTSTLKEVSDIARDFLGRPE